MITRMTRLVYTCAGCHLEEKDERLEESLEVVNVVEAASDLDVLEEAHTEDSEDEHDEEEEEADVEEGGHGHDEGEEEGADALGALDQPQHTTHLRKMYFWKYVTFEREEKGFSMKAFCIM